MAIIVWIIPLLSPFGTNHGTTAPMTSQNSVNSATGAAEAPILQLVSVHVCIFLYLFQKPMGNEYHQLELVTQANGMGGSQPSQPVPALQAAAVHAGRFRSMIPLSLLV